MKYNFNEVLNRENQNAAKWDELNTNFEKEGLLPMWIADMDFKVAPQIVKSIENRLNEQIFGYVSRPKSYYESAINWSRNRHNHQIDEKSIIHTPGVITTISIVLDTLAKDADKVLIQTPVYSGFIEVLKSHNKTIIENKLIEREDGRWEIDLIDFESKIKNENIKWFLLCNPHNPVGRVWTKEELEKMAEICLKYDVRIIADEIWRDLVFKDYKFTSIASLSKEIERITITCFSPTKTFNLAGLQASFGIFPIKEEKDIIENKLMQLSIKRNNSFNVVAIETAYNKCEDWLDELINYLQENVNFVIDYAKNNIKDLKITRPEGTYLLWLDFRSLNISHDDIFKALIEEGEIALNDGEDFGECGRGFFRMNIACPRSVVEDGIKRIERAVNSCKNKVLEEKLVYDKK